MENDVPEEKNIPPKDLNSKVFPENGKAWQNRKAKQFCKSLLFLKRFESGFKESKRCLCKKSRGFQKGKEEESKSEKES